jgi:HEXXH motif-containing protein
MVEAVIHELQHNKLNALAYHDALLHNAFWPLVASPVRPDPRPLWGVLLAVHAFLPVAELYRLLDEAGHPLAAHPGYRKRWRQIVTGNHEGMTTLLGHAEPTPLGRELLSELSALDERHQALVAGWTPPISQ